MRQTVVDFKILASKDTDVLAAQILDHVTKGWSLHGEMKTHGDKLVQSIVKVKLERMDSSDIVVPTPILRQ